MFWSFSSGTASDIFNAACVVAGLVVDSARAWLAHPAQMIDNAITRFRGMGILPMHLRLEPLEQSERCHGQDAHDTIDGLRNRMRITTSL
jgi:hypothetical protein